MQGSIVVLDSHAGPPAVTVSHIAARATPLCAFEPDLTVIRIGEVSVILEPRHLAAFANALHGVAAELVDRCTLARLEADVAGTNEADAQPDLSQPHAAKRDHGPRSVA